MQIRESATPAIQGVNGRTGLRAHYRWRIQSVTRAAYVQSFEGSRVSAMKKLERGVRAAGCMLRGERSAEQAPCGEGAAAAHGGSGITVEREEKEGPPCGSC
jgi:hypothetical protein